MKFHAPSFLLGVGVTSAIVATRTRMRPVVVELAALGAHLGRLGRSLVARQREELEDLWAEIEERAHQRVREERKPRAPSPSPSNGSGSGNGNGAARVRA
jgi:hypothetical protein